MPIDSTDVVQATADLTANEARALTDRIRGVALELVDLVQAAFDGRAWLALGYPTWAAYLEAEVGTALRGLDVDQRLAITGTLHDSAMSARAISRVIGRSPERVGADLRVIRDGAATTTILGQDGKTYTRVPSRAALPAKPVVKTLSALELLAAAGPDGLTIPELMRKRRSWTYGQASATLSRLHAQHDRDGARRIERLDVWRGGYSVYVHPDNLGQRSTLEPGQRRATGDARTS